MVTKARYQATDGESEGRPLYGLLVLGTDLKFIFGEVLAQQFTEKRVVQKELAKELSVHPSAINHWLMGRRLPPATTLYLLAKALRLQAQERNALTAAWHLSLLANDLIEYVRAALDRGDEEAARTIFVDLLQSDWGVLFSEKWIHYYYSLVSPEILRKKTPPHQQPKQ